ncbi:hypothetical protein P153DRAFT_306831 [Dothidotthia symphoricarpi CBS 119687]|uniref:Uncharacterized protein n=1 Tax=Dothidotthia symphoricarpi CBS 119687 TaxID=1392245 RepID=A0A6A6AQF3_9PLEO|nr:uncharacterized protein P153DRAFT_306831 [Dothidotthia symphoricarpi CBS 119687]KAF2134030.1 hypothetical protein P153DRAFT_306831 [Dothidotthia symphoricarpi CBS 119687]
MATLAAHDQENVVRALHTGPAGKPLNAGLKSFAAKTPANKAPKTPFKVPLNDENAVAKGGKSVLQTKGKGTENLLMTSKKSGKLDENAFITPAAQRTRAPLGMKTTNAKGKAFQTPAPLSSAKTQKVSPRMRRPKVKIHQPEPESASEDDVPDIEYMPPKEVPLADDMDDYLPRDAKFPMFEGANMTRGVWETYHNPIEDDGRTRMQREFDEGLERDRKKRDEQFDKLFEEQQAKDDAEMRRYFGIDESKKEAPKTNLKPAAPKRTNSSLSTMRARSAAAALSSTSKPSYAAPTTATKSRLPNSLVSSKKPAKPLAERSASRQAAAAAASKSTIGYAQGRASRSGPAVRKPLSNVTKPPPFSAATRRPATASSIHHRSASAAPTVGRVQAPSSRSISTSSDATLVAPPVTDERNYRTAEDLEREMNLLLLQDDEDADADAWMNNFNSQLHGDPIDEDQEDFQFQLPEGF